MLRRGTCGEIIKTSSLAWRARPRPSKTEADNGADARPAEVAAGTVACRAAIIATIIAGTIVINIANTEGEEEAKASDDDDDEADHNDD